jgi:hypothetical protein
VLDKAGQERDLTPGAKLKASFAGWTPDGSAFFVASNERDARYFDLYRYRHAPERQGTRHAVNPLSRFALRRGKARARPCATTLRR